MYRRWLSLGGVVAKAALDEIMSQKRLFLIQPN
jgi:hypothetical protein